ncbi:Gfo/Idh/MocA family oxidoreductase [Desulfovibrio sp. OttesenSCG-928-I05]|nr:Gfo/Idh/MocA family oxidoreductase [Desulfovibrio sp. OttesenSCG-928-I05]
MPQTIQGRKIRIAVAGCGRISRKHFESIALQADNLELVAVCDTNPEVLEKHATALCVPGYHNFEEMLRENDHDLVSLCTPSGLHAQQTILAARYGKHVMTEKPMATHWQEGVDMVRACDDADVRLFVIKQNRLNPPLQFLKRAVTEKRFGRIYMVTINVFWTRPQEYYDSAPWRGTWEMDGGAFMNQASHYVDLLDWLIGPVADVQAMTGTLARDIEVEDTGVLNVRWRNGALGSMAVTMLTYPKNMEGSITILGEKGTVRIGGVALNKVDLWSFSESAEYDKFAKNSGYEPSSVYGNSHTLYIKNVIDTLRGNAQPETDGREGLKSLELLIAAYLSARDHKSISLPLHY